MIQSFTVTNPNGKSMVCDLANPWKEGLAVASIDGLGPGQATINTADISSMDGGLFNSSRKGTRNIVLNLIFVDHDTLSIEDIRRKCYIYFPLKKQVNLKITTGNGINSKEYLIDGYVESNEPVIFSSQEGATISLICPKPYFYRQVDQEQRFTVSASPEFVFAFHKAPDDATEAATLLRMGDIVNYVLANVYYEGDADTGIAVEIVFHSDLGTSSSERTIAISNSLTNTKTTISLDKVESIMEYFDETFDGIKEGDKLRLSTVKGEKYLTFTRDNTDYNMLSAVSSSGEWVYISKGTNILRIDAVPAETEISASSINKIYYYGV